MRSLWCISIKIADIASDPNELGAARPIPRRSDINQEPSIVFMLLINSIEIEISGDIAMPTWHVGSDVFRLYPYPTFHTLKRLGVWEASDTKKSVRLESSLNDGGAGFWGCATDRE